MTFTAEPYGAFVEDLLANLTGGVSRVRFRFVEEELPFRLGTGVAVRPGTLRAHGIAGGVHTEFVPGRDLVLEPDATLTWRAGGPGVPAAGAVWPDPGTDVWVGYETAPDGRAPLLDDRNPGSVVRTVAEAFAREFAVLSHQLGLVHDGAFVATATGRDLDQLAALVGLARRGATHARGEVVFRRATPASADITVPAGTLVSSASAPATSAETVEAATLRRGTFSVAVPVRAQVSGPGGAAAARVLTVVHRPVFGVEEVLNPEPLAFGGGPEPDPELRARVRRALEVSGRGTLGALRGALAGLEGIREQDVLVVEDHLAAPGVVRVSVAAEVDDATRLQASRLLEEHRPAGIRVVHNLPAPTALVPSLPQDTGGGGDGPTGGPPPAGAGEGEDVFAAVQALLTVTPADLELTQEQRDRLARDAADALLVAAGQAGAGETLVYNRLVAAVMPVSGVLDAVLEIGWRGGELRRFNLRPPDGRRPRLAPDDLTVRVRGDRVVLDVAVSVERTGPVAVAEPTAALARIRHDVERKLTEAFHLTPARLDAATLRGALPVTADYAVEDVNYTVELVDEGLRVTRAGVELDLDPGQVVWVRSVAVTEEVSAS